MRFYVCDTEGFDHQFVVADSLTIEQFGFDDRKAADEACDFLNALSDRAEIAEERLLRAVETAIEWRELACGSFGRMFLGQIIPWSAFAAAVSSRETRATP